MSLEEIQHNYLHVDLDAFFASVEQLDNPQYKGLPVIVGAKPEDRRGVVSTASYEARKFGVHSAMPIYQAYKLCPQGIYLYGRMKRYAELSYQIMTIFKDFSPDVTQMSIDEAFIDLTGTEKLFGPAEETALKIKQRVKEETGLTVSVGLASTKYLAKIASGYSKPDGFYHVKPGLEVDFMLSLPLDKLWGVGTKTQELIKSKGIKTTRDIYEKDLDLLQFMFGNNLGTYLYEAVRGNEKLTFDHKSKNHSISAESTFPFDLTDSYTAETELMELCYGVYFRLLREEGFSRTATLKIRYDDFSTTNIQETQDRNIMTLDSFYEIIKRLFEKKYEVGRGIRLLGVGFDNIEKEDRPYQQDLFETDNSKKAKIEKAILNMSKKNPDLKVQKARMIKTTVIALCTGFLLSVFSNQIYAKENTTESLGAATVLPDSFSPPETSKNPVSVFKWELTEDSDIDFLISGYWQTQFEENLSFVFGGNSRAPQFSFGVPIFKQEVDISFLANLKQTWTMQADFADAFAKNTLSLSYNGQSYLKSAKISNRNISMPDFYTANYFGYGISGGDSQAPGFTLHFEDKDKSLWSGDFLLRYDMTQEKNATFFGLNSVTDSYINIENYVHGKSFIFPLEAAEELAEILDIYVENRSGNVRDQNGKYYKKLTKDEYLIYITQGRLELSSSAQSLQTTTGSDSFLPTIAITFSSELAVQNIINTLGSYSNPDSYLGQIQTLFSDFDLTKFSYNLIGKIENSTALIIQNSTGFSPFSDAHLYDCGIISEADIQIISKNSKQQQDNYIAETKNSLNNDYFSENHKFVEIFETSALNKSLQFPESRYPFAKTTPEIYLNLSPSSDLTLLLRSYSQLNNINIGNNAIEGTIQVYKNDILDYGAKYNHSTGIITLSTAVDTTDKIYVIWKEDGNQNNNGLLVSGAGLKYTFNNNLYLDTAITSKWPLTPINNYTTVDLAENGFTALSTGIYFKKNNLKLEDKVSVSIQNKNATGILLVSSSENSASKTNYLSSSSNYKTQVTPLLNLKDSLSAPILTNQNNFTIYSQNPLMDKDITGYKVPLSFDFTNCREDEVGWASIDIKLNTGTKLNNSSQIEIALQNDCDLTGYDLYIQLGVNANLNFYGENNELIPTWKINDSYTDKEYDFTSTKWQTVTLELTDFDRSRLSYNSDARLVIVKNENSKTSNSSGTIYIGPYEQKNQNIKVTASQEIYTITKQVLTTSPSSQELKLQNNCSSEIYWNYLGNTPDNPIIAGTKYFTAADFSSYKSINFDVAFKEIKKTPFENTKTESSLFTFILDNNQENSNLDDKTAVKLELYDLDDLYSEIEQFHTFTITINEKQLLIDGKIISSDKYYIEINKNIVPIRQKIELNTQTEKYNYEQGYLVIDNLYYKDTSPSFVGQNNIAVEYTNSDDLLKVKKYTLLKNLTFSADSTQSIQAELNSNNIGKQIYTNGALGFTFANLILSTDIHTQDLMIKNAGHNIKTDNAILGVLSFSEVYRFSNTDLSLKKSDNASLNLSKIKIPLKIDFTATSSELTTGKTQTSKLSADFTPVIKNTKISATSSLAVNQRIVTKKSAFQDYFSEYSDITKLEFSMGEENAQDRDINFTYKLGITNNKVKFNPSLEYSLKNQVKNLNTQTTNTTEFLKLGLPFSIRNNNLSFNISRTNISENTINKSENYISDIQYLFNSQNEKTYFYTAIPFYELFDTNLNQEVLNANKDKINTQLSSKYELLWKRKIFNNYKDIFVPSAASFAIVREIKNSDIQSDVYQIKSIISENAINCFGQKSNLQLFNWYLQDEFLSNLTFIIKVPKNNLKEINYQTSMYSQILFYISQTEAIHTAFDFTIQSNLDWNLRSTFLWNHPGEKSFVVNLLNCIKPVSEKNPVYKISRKETANLSVGQQQKILKQNYQFYHNADINFLTHYTLTTGIGCEINLIQNSSDTISLKATIGGKMEF